MSRRCGPNTAGSTSSAAVSAVEVVLAPEQVERDRRASCGGARRPRRRARSSRPRASQQIAGRPRPVEAQRESASSSSRTATLPTANSIPTANRSSHHGSQSLSWPMRPSEKPALSTNAFQATETSDEDRDADDLAAQPRFGRAPRATRRDEVRPDRDEDVERDLGRERPRLQQRPERVAGEVDVQ